MITKTIEKHPAQIGMVSLVGVHGEYPLSFGNYFSLSSGLRIINMWAENLEEYNRQHNLIDVECTVFSNGKRSLGFITDERIPKEWLIDGRLCITGCGWGSRELAEACLQFAELPNINSYCGCEQPEQHPKISQMISFQPRVCTNTCHNCGRKWES